MGGNRTIVECVHREGHFSEQNFCTVLVWGIMFMILTLEEINKDRENSKMEYKQKQMNEIVFQQNSSEEPDTPGGNQIARAAKKIVNSEHKISTLSFRLKTKRTLNNI